MKTCFDKTCEDRKADISASIEKYEISVDCTFIPFSQSRNCKARKANWFIKPNWPSLNWLVTVNMRGKQILTTDYFQGIAHIPGYKQTLRKNFTLFEAGIISEAINTGSVPHHPSPHMARIGKIPNPDIDDIIYSLLMDGAADFDYSSFEDWVSDFGYDPDSRKALEAFEACRGIGAKLRHALGMEVIDRLRDVFQDY